MSNEVDANKDYPLGTNRPDLVKTPTNKDLEDITLEKVLEGEVEDADLSITEETLDHQAEIAKQKGREQFGKNMERAGELTNIPDDRILEIYNSLRPNRSTKEELLAIADELEEEYEATTTAQLVREAAEVYEKRDKLRSE
ncbi:diol dehydratase small subunit [Halanaerobacter jeridensis]|uniref:Propanediol dehydratase small subunit n=1 Tax=Halanaerobacter jeridensis TaxID=706427 RepID=A0A939BSH5_9FIRM|nr:diol dehydratase small subunit [Halanaerobacter jeridensis]MBM7557151.1 propanediol dehydratase small subunit [Halanaerobacter jeridensis]